MKTFFETLTLVTTLALALTCANIAEAQPTTTNGWPITNPTFPPVVGANGIGQVYVLNGITLAPATTNTYTVGNYSNTNVTGLGLNQVFINTSSYDNIGLGLQSLVLTNSASTNLNGNITLLCAKSWDGVHAESTPSISLTLNSSGNWVTNLATATPNQYAGSFSNIDVHGCAGLFVTSVAETNLGVNSATNTFSLIVNTKITKVATVPASYY